jgi:hypothetical protein
MLDAHETPEGRERKAENGGAAVSAVASPRFQLV